MADVLLVYVQEDRAYAEGIGGSLERSGLTVAYGDGAAFTGAEAPCVLVLWSAHSTRSAIVRDLAIRAQREGKLITAKLAGCEAPLGFARPAPHDLSLWVGDPDDPALDPLFFAADRLVCSARINATRTPQQPIYSQGAHVHNPGAVRPLRAGPIASVGPSAARAARIEPESAPMRANDPALPPNVAQEAIAWKRIEHSTDPKDFLDYLMAFSPNGMFCELAQLKLDKLTPKGAKPAFIPHNPSPYSAKPRASEATRERRAAAQAREDRPAPIDPPRAAPPYDQRPPEPRLPRPEARLEPRYEARPEFRPESRPEPRPEPRAEPRPEPRYEARPRPRPETREEEFEHGPIVAQRTATNRARRRPAPAQEARAEPREGGGLPWRPVLIVALLAAGGFAFFQMLPKQSSSTEEASLSSPDLADATRAAPLDGLGAPGEVAVPRGSGTSLTGVGGPDTAAAAPRPATRPPVAAPIPAPQSRQVASATQARPEPVISFRPPPEAAAPQPSATPVIAAQPSPVQPQPQPAAPVVTQPTPAPAQAAPTPAPAAAAAANANSDFVTPTWVRRPGGQQLADAYPRRASEKNVAGRVVLECVIQTGGSLACIPISATPDGYGFAEAGTSVARFFRAAPANAQGFSIVGKRTRLTIAFAPAG